jgi:hypothetical protein
MRAILLTILLLSFLLGSAIVAPAAILEFDLSPPGAGPAVGLHPLNEVIPGSSTGSGNEIGAGIFFDTSTRLLTLNLAYGSAFGFTDLTSPAFSWLLHGPAPLGETAPVLFNLQAFHAFAPNPGQGGQIAGSLTLDAAQEAGLLAGLNYINIYTPANLGGELRGQLILVPEPHPLALVLGAGALALLWRAVRARRRIGPV